MRKKVKYTPAPKKGKISFTQLNTAVEETQLDTTSDASSVCNEASCMLKFAETCVQKHSAGNVVLSQASTLWKFFSKEVPQNSSASSSVPLQERFCVVNSKHGESLPDEAFTTYLDVLRQAKEENHLSVAETSITSFPLKANHLPVTVEQDDYSEINDLQTTQLAVDSPSLLAKRKLDTKNQEEESEEPFSSDDIFRDSEMQPKPIISGISSGNNNSISGGDEGMTIADNDESSDQSESDEDDIDNDISFYGTFTDLKEVPKSSRLLENDDPFKPKKLFSTPFPTRKVGPTFVEFSDHTESKEDSLDQTSQVDSLPNDSEEVQETVNQDRHVQLSDMNDVNTSGMYNEDEAIDDKETVTLDSPKPEVIQDSDVSANAIAPFVSSQQPFPSSELLSKPTMDGQERKHLEQEDLLKFIQDNPDFLFSQFPTSSSSSSAAVQQPVAKPLSSISNLSSSSVSFSSYNADDPLLIQQWPSLFWERCKIINLPLPQLIPNPYSHQVFSKQLDNQLVTSTEESKKKKDYYIVYWIQKNLFLQNNLALLVCLWLAERLKLPIVAMVRRLFFLFVNVSFFPSSLTRCLDSDRRRAYSRSKAIY
jgi:hypothetical protein